MQRIQPSRYVPTRPRRGCSACARTRARRARTRATGVCSSRSLRTAIICAIPPRSASRSPSARRFTSASRARSAARPRCSRSRPPWRPGRHAFTWFPPPTTAPRTYLTLLEVEDAAGNRRSYGAGNAETGRHSTTPVIRVLGVDAGFTRESYVPGEEAGLRVETDASTFSLQVFRAGPEDVPTYNDTLMNGVPVTEPVPVAGRASIVRRRSRSRSGRGRPACTSRSSRRTTDASASRRSSSGLRSSAPPESP